MTDKNENPRKDTPMECGRCHQKLQNNSNGCPKSNGGPHQPMSISDKGVQGQGHEEGMESSDNSKPDDPKNYHSNTPHKTSKTAGNTEMSQGSNGTRFRMNCAECGAKGEWHKSSTPAHREADAHSTDHVVERQDKKIKNAKVAYLRDPIRMYAMQYVAHDSGDGQTIFHCPFCGSGQVTGRSDGTVECNFCKTCFTVQVQPEQMGMPQTVDGQPYQMPGMPYGQDPNAPVDDGSGIDPETGQPIEDPMADPGEQDPDGSDLGSPQDEEDQDASKDSAPWMRESSRVFLVPGGALTEANFMKRLAIQFADDPQFVINEIKGR